MSNTVIHNFEIKKFLGEVDVLGVTSDGKPILRYGEGGATQIKIELTTTDEKLISYFLRLIDLYKGKGKE